MKTCLFRTFTSGAALVLALVLSLASLPSVSAQDASEFNPLGREIPIEDLQKQLRIQIEWFEMDHKELTALLEPEDFSKPQVRNSSNDGPLREKMKELVADDKAKLLETSIIIARSGQRAKTESIHEYIYPTEYDPPMLSTAAGGDGDAGAGNTASLPNATAFETRNVGTTLEVDPVIGIDNRTIDLNLAPEMVYPVGELIYGEYKSGESKVTMTQPIFYTVRITTQVTMIAGEYLFLGSMTPFESETGLPNHERKILAFVKSDVIYSGLPLELVNPRPSNEVKPEEKEKDKAKTRGKDKDKSKNGGAEKK